MFKPFNGYIKNWHKSPVNVSLGLGFQIVGDFVDHPQFAGGRGWTSYVVAYNEQTGEIETANSRYKLIANEVSENEG